MKAFISHSSAQKDFVTEIAELFGRDNCIVDEYDFSPAYKTIDEIIEKISKAGAFVFLISQESLKSNWCETEVKKARQRVNDGKLKLFLPYIIDEDIDLSMVKEKYDWIVSEDTYNLKFFRSPKMIVRDLELKFRNIAREKFEAIKAPDEIFVGRNEQINEFQVKKSNKMKAKSLIISGRVGTGRHRFSQRCADEVGHIGKYFFEQIDLPKNGGLSELIALLNLSTGILSEEMINDILRSDENTQLVAAIDQINEIYRYQGRIRINDNNAIINYRSELVGWYRKLLDDARLKSLLGLYVISSTNLRASEESSNNTLIAIRMPEFTRTERKIILTSYLSHLTVNTFEEDIIDQCVEKLRQSPAQLVNIAHILAANGVGEARQCLDKFRDEGDIRISELLSIYEENENAKDFLSLISRTGMLGYEDIKAIYEDEYEGIKPIIEDLISRSIIYETGASGSMLVIDTVIGDYLIRIKSIIPKKIMKKLNRYLTNTAEHATSLTESPSLYMMRWKKIMEDGRFELKNLLLPSIAMNHLVSMYHSGEKYKAVVDFAQKLLDNDMTIFKGEEIRQEILFWECLSHAHLRQKETFYERVEGISDPANKFFLKGFFKNKSEDYEAAIKDFQRALERVPSMNKAKRELVTSYIKLKRYDDALKYAKENFEASKENSYHITAYFECILCKKGRSRDDELILEQLLGIVERSFLPNKEAIGKGMRMLRRVRTPGQDREELFKEIFEMEHSFPNDKYVKDIANKSRQYLGK